MDKNDINTLQMVLLGIIEERNWSRLRDCLDRPPFIIAARSFKQNPSFYGANILHLVLRNWPSRDIIKIIIKRLPETLAEIDCTGRAPLHVAAGLGVNAKVVHEIARAYPRACLIQDLDGELRAVGRTYIIRFLS